ncbi:MAG: sulfite exporter TauE/SafE family protein, partial [Bacteroidota bacterium]
MVQVIKSFIGFSKDWSVMGELINWPFLLSLMALMVVGILAGNHVSTFLSGNKLRKVYSWFVLGIAILILGKELVLH